MKYSIYQVDAFSDTLFGGNPAAVCPLETWLEDSLMQKLAQENNLSETAFFVPKGEGFELRWFTPEVEVDLCGHATLATAHVIFNHLSYQKAEIQFHTKSGLLKVKKEGNRLQMDFPSGKMDKVDAPEKLIRALGVNSAEVFKSDDYMVVVNSEDVVKNLRPDFRLLAQVDARGVIVTAQGDEVDFVSRFFAPQVGIDEDPVTGSAHTKLTPYWSESLNKTELSARQISKRGGALTCRYNGERTEILGKAVTYMVGEFYI